MKICIRADGGSQIGMGHIMRMSALANCLKKSYDVFFACRVSEDEYDKYSAGIEFLKDNKFDVIEINENNIKEELKVIDADCIITDSYDVDEDYFNVLKDNFKVSGYIDDEMICEYFNVDFIINQNLYGKTFDYKVNNDTKLMTGPEYVILRDEFRTHINEKEIKKDIEDIMITVGGSDDNNFTEAIIKQLMNLDCTLHVVIGRGFKYVEKLMAYESEKIKLYKNANMKYLMENCDVCVAGCGSTVYELAVCKTPFIGISLIENQDMMVDFIKKNNITRTSKIDTVKDEIENFTYDERMETSKKLGSLVDGNGILKIIKGIDEILKGKREN